MSIRRLFPAFGVVAVALLMRGAAPVAAAPLASHGLSCVIVAGHALAVTPEQQAELASEGRPTPGQTDWTLPPCAVTLDVTNAISKPRPQVGETVTWSVSVTNRSRSVAPQVVVNDRLPGEARTWNVGDLAPGQRRSFDVRTVVTSADSQHSCAQAFSLIPALPPLEPGFGALDVGLSGSMELGRTSRVCATSAPARAGSPGLISDAGPPTPSPHGPTSQPSPTPSPTASTRPVSSPGPSPGAAVAGPPMPPVLSAPSASSRTTPRPASSSGRKQAPAHDSPTPAAAYIAPNQDASANSAVVPAELSVAGLPDTGWPVWSGLTGLILIVIGTVITWVHLRRVVWTALVFYGEGLMHWIDRCTDL